MHDNRYGGIMNQKHLALLLALSLFVAGCDLVGDIFQAGLAVGIITVILIVAIIGWLVGKFRGKPRQP